MRQFKIFLLLLVFLSSNLAEEEPNRNLELGNAAADVDVDTVRRLLGEGGVDVNWRDPALYIAGAFVLMNSTALHRVTACYQCDVTKASQIVHLLIEHGADVNSRAPQDKTGLTPLIMASFDCQAEAVRLLLDQGADIKARQGVYNNTALLKACYCKLGPDTARVLLDHGADTEERDSFGDTGLNIAANLGNLETIRLLLDRGADINAKEYTESRTALAEAAMMGQEEVVRFLLSRGASRDGCDPAQWTLCKLED